MTARGFSFTTLALAASLSFGGVACNSSSPDKAGPAGPERVEGAPWEGAVPAGYPKWPPPYLFQFAGFDFPNTIGGIHVDDRYVYWGQKSAGGFMRVEKTNPGNPEFFLDCSGGCDSDQSASDGTNFYTLAGSHVLRVSVADATRTELPLDWNHTNGALLVDERYVYTAMHGCPALTRIDKQTLAKEVMEIDGVGYPGRGRSALAKAGSALVCGSPSEIFVIDAWGGEARRIFTDVHQGFSVAATGDRAFFLEDGDEWATIGAVPLAGGSAQRLLEDQEGGFALPLLSAPSVGNVIWGDNRGLRSLDTHDSSLGATAVGYVQTVDADATDAYATVSGFMPETVNGRPESVRAFWIARVSLAELASSAAPKP
ncbi:MAG TPA: hypothetical protein VFV94_10375 [Polyangiaceae bacterium]|nr:hypothetical protein [Polyangiaceae bacterium]